ncbi:MAG: hypothetical protein A2173_08395 [Planctomycetes bacterium RBG_13_44_8b]|nr:MAG: hypothetical protein A2173_08395 [Planctomycetes bacterium RBG_13_44_8b]
MPPVYFTHTIRLHNRAINRFWQTYSPPAVLFFIGSITILLNPCNFLQKKEQRFPKTVLGKKLMYYKLLSAIVLNRLKKQRPKTQKNTPAPLISANKVTEKLTHP